MSDLDFDLNAHAAPSLTLDAAPAAPTLTLDPEADAKVVEEAKKATPVTVEDTPLSPEEQKMVQDFASKIELSKDRLDQLPDDFAVRRRQPEKAERFF